MFTNEEMDYTLGLIRGSLAKISGTVEYLGDEVCESDVPIVFQTIWSELSLRCEGLDARLASLQRQLADPEKPLAQLYQEMSNQSSTIPQVQA